jgi:hypothetical protein
LATYDAIEADIKRLKDDIVDIKMRTHFLGGIVRLAAHDFMDYDRNNPSLKLGPDGCVDFTHSNNQGLGSIWTPGAQLYELYQTKYSWISRADFWVASANAVIKITSVNNINTAYNIGYTLRTNYKWGRLDRATCVGSGTRLAIPSRCAEVEKVFLTQMGLTWTDAVALLGGHTLGRGSSNVSVCSSFNQYLYTQCVLTYIYNMLNPCCKIISLFFSFILCIVFRSRGYMERQ